MTLLDSCFISLELSQELLNSRIYYKSIVLALFRNQKEFVRSLNTVISYQTTQNVMDLKSFPKQKVIAALFLAIHLHCQLY